MFDSVRPHRRQPARLHRPWDSPGKNTGVGCHCLLRRTHLPHKITPGVGIEQPMELETDGGRFQQPHCSLGVLKPVERRKWSREQKWDHHGKDLGRYLSSAKTAVQCFAAERVELWQNDLVLLFVWVVIMLPLSLIPPGTSFVSHTLIPFFLYLIKHAKGNICHLYLWQCSFYKYNFQLNIEYIS